MNEFKRKVYLETIDLNDAKKIIDEVILRQCKILNKEEISVENVLHRITTDAVFSKLSSPYYNASAMDGIAVIAKKTHEADLTNPIELKKGIDFIYVNTGDLIPSPFDAVIMVEDIIFEKDDVVMINKSCSQFQHIRPIGEDIVANEMIVSAHHFIRPVDIAAMVASGVESVSVYEKPVVSIIPTGDEIIHNPHKMEEGKIIDSNSHFIKNSVIELGGIPKKSVPIKDQYDAIKEKIQESVKSSNLVLVVAGSSSGTKDYTASIIKELGTVYAHGIAIKPGKPVIIGMVDDTPVIGIPGYPVSTYIAFLEIVKLIISGLYHQEIKTNPIVKATLTKKIYSSLNNLEFVRVKLGIVNDQLIATPLHRGAGVTMSLVKADGILKIDKHSEGYEANSIVSIELLKDMNEIKQAIVSIGSHDIILDYIANLLKKRSKTQLASAHVGSFSGVMAIKRGECHMAPIHILDEVTGTYNINVLHKYFKDEVVLMKGIKREQGLMIRKDNKKNIKSIRDLNRDYVSFINRQKGSGTRILLDYLLKQEKINENDISGYEFEVTTHMMVGSSVASGAVDCGLGVRSAADIFDLDFIPCGFEDYDFLVLRNALDTPKMKDFIKVIQSEAFKDLITKLGGYKIENIGEVVI